MSWEQFFNLNSFEIPKSKKSNQFQKKKQPRPQINNPWNLPESSFDFISKAGGEFNILDVKPFESYIGGGGQSDDFFAYLEPSAPRSSYGKEDKKTKAKRSVGQEFETIYGIESLGMALENSEMNLGNVMPAFGQRVQKSSKNLKADIGRLRHPEEGSVLQRLQKKRAVGKLKKQMKDLADLDESTTRSSMTKADMEANPDIEVQDRGRYL